MPLQAWILGQVDSAENDTLPEMMPISQSMADTLYRHATLIRLIDPRNWWKTKMAPYEIIPRYETESFSKSENVVVLREVVWRLDPAIPCLFSRASNCSYLADLR
jgi:hypothetical protein